MTDQASASLAALQALWRAYAEDRCYGYDVYQRCSDDLQPFLDREQAPVRDASLAALQAKWREESREAAETAAEAESKGLLVTAAGQLERCATSREHGDDLQPHIDREQAQRQEAIHCRECDLEVPDNGDLVCCDCVRELQNTVESIAMMLGWGNVPPCEMLERDINALKSQVESLQQENERLKTDWRARAREFTKLFKRMRAR